MTRWHKQAEANTYFLTANVRRRIPLFKVFPESCRILLGSLDHYRLKYPLKVVGYVVMPDHLHMLIHMTELFNLSDFLRDWKGYVAHTTVRRLRERQLGVLLNRFAATPRRSRDSHYQIFQSDTHVETVRTHRFLQQKLDYIHDNPVVEGLVDTVVDYPYSSARNYHLNDGSVFQIDRVEL